MINFSIIIPNLNGAKYLRECLRHLHFAISACPQSKFEIIIVDNGSTDDSLSLCQNYQIIRNLKNLGFAAAVNQGIKTSKYSYVVLLNNDVNLDKDWFNFLYYTIQRNPTAACFCGTVRNKDGSEIESMGISFNWSGKCLQEKQNLSGPIWGSSGAAVIYQKEILFKIGLFDEKYFAYIEDVDVAFQLQKHNYQTILNTKAICYHLGGATSNKMGNFRAKQTFKNWIYFIFKNYTLREIIKYSPQIFLERLRNLSYLLKSSIKL